MEVSILRSILDSTNRFLRKTIYDHKRKKIQKKNSKNKFQKKKFPKKKIQKKLTKKNSFRFALNFS